MLQGRKIEAIKTAVEVDAITPLSLAEISVIDDPGLKSLHMSIHYATAPMMQRKSNLAVSEIVRLINEGDYETAFELPLLRKKNNLPYNDLSADALTAVLEKKISVNTYLFIIIIQNGLNWALDQGVSFSFEKVENLEITEEYQRELTAFKTLAKQADDKSVQYCIKFSIKEVFSQIKKIVTPFTKYYFLNNELELFFFHPSLVDRYLNAINSSIKFSIMPWLGDVDFKNWFNLRKEYPGEIVSFSPPGKITGIKKILRDLNRLDVYRASPRNEKNITYVEYYRRNTSSRFQNKSDALLFLLDEIPRVDSTLLTDPQKWMPLIDFTQDKFYFERIKFICFIAWVEGKALFKGTLYEQMARDAQVYLSQTSHDILLTAAFILLEDFYPDNASVNTIKQFLKHNSDQVSCTTLLNPRSLSINALEGSSLIITGQEIFPNQSNKEQALNTIIENINTLEQDLSVQKKVALR